MSRAGGTVLCLSHVRWKSVYQRPHHLMSRCARDHDVVFFEEPIRDVDRPILATEYLPCGVIVAVPHLPPGMSGMESDAAQRKMIGRLLDNELSAARPILWYCTPMALAFTHHVRPRAIVYDCTDELSLFDGAPAGLAARETLLFENADVVFAGGQRLYEHKRATSGHPNVHAFPSSVDAPHFAEARYELVEPVDQQGIRGPRVGFFGVIDERLDTALLAGLADARPDLQLVMLGPVAKIDPATLPRRQNIHWLGARSYRELPAYIAGWDVAMLPFARNDSTRFSSPTKTLEYLAAGKPVVSTSIRDVVTPYGRDGLAWIADTVDEFSLAIDAALASDRRARIAHADQFLANHSWDRTWIAMWNHIQLAIEARAMRQSGLDVIARPGATARAQQRRSPGGRPDQK